MKNFIQVGDVLDYTNAGSDIAAGDVVVMGDRVGVAVTAIASGATGALRVRGVVELDKATGTGIAQGENCYWSAANSNIQATDSSAVLAGFAVAGTDSAATRIRVSLNA